MDKELLAVAGGSKPADVVISNGRIVNVYTGEIYDGGVAISGQTIAAVGDVDYCIGEGTKTIVNCLPFLQRTPFPERQKK